MKRQAQYLKPGDVVAGFRSPETVVYVELDPYNSRKVDLILKGADGKHRRATWNRTTEIRLEQK